MNLGCEVSNVYLSQNIGTGGRPTSRLVVTGPQFLCLWERGGWSSKDSHILFFTVCGRALCLEHLSYCKVFGMSFATRGSVRLAILLVRVHHFPDQIVIWRLLEYFHPNTQGLQRKEPRQ